MKGQELDEMGQKFVKEIRQRMDERNLNDTGAGSASLSYKVEGDKLIIEGVARLLFLEFGRRPNKSYTKDSWRELMPFIRPWVARKLGVPDSENFALARHISDRIAKDGTRILADRTKGLELELILNDLNQELFNDIATKQAAIITDGLIKAWQSNN